MQIEASTVEIEERGVKLRLTVVDTPGYGDAINSQDWCVCTMVDDGRSSYSSCALAPISCCVGSLPPPRPSLFPSSSLLRFLLIVLTYLCLGLVV